MADATDTACAVEPSELDGCATVLTVPDGKGGRLAVPLTVREHRALAERLVAMLGVTMGLPPGDDEAFVLCDRCGAYRMRLFMVDASYAADRPGVRTIETRWYCRSGCAWSEHSVVTG